MVKSDSGDQTLACPHQLAEETTLLLGAVTKNRVHADICIHEHHAASLTNGRFTGVQFDLDKLHFTALDFVIHNIHRHERCSKKQHGEVRD